VRSVKRSIILLSRGRAAVVDPKDYAVYTWDEWITLQPEENELAIISTRGLIKAPEVVILTHYGKVPATRPRLTKRNIFVRDGYKCQYTGKKVTLKDGDIDHIIPKSKNGKTTWDNLVVCSKEVNRKKGDKTPAQAGLKLNKVPKQPRYKDLLIDPRTEVPESWRKFL
jgi:5-methylcytosine-specific restriction endonuclease McrA